MKKIFFTITLATILLLFGCDSKAFKAEATPTAIPIVEVSPTPLPTPTPTPEPFADGFDICGVHYKKDTTFIDFRNYKKKDLETLRNVYPYLTNLKKLNLGNEQFNPIPWKRIYNLTQEFRDVKIIYHFNIYGKNCSLQDTVLDLNHCEIDDQGEYIRQIISCMPNLKYLDLDTCGIDSEHCAAIRDDFPDMEVVWRIWFGSRNRYTVRTDVERILASKPSAYGNLTTENTHDLMYCTKVKYLDLGHNDSLGSIEFCSYMPELEVAIIAMTFRVKDISPLQNCPKLEFLELQSNKIIDVAPLSDLKNLEYLNLVQNFDLRDITPLYGLHKLKKLWLGCTDPVPKEQIEEFKNQNPDCSVNTISFDPHEGDWRYDFSRESHVSERYELLVEQFGYKGEASPYSIAENDPLFQPH